MGMEHVDIYCERVGPGLWGEPVNALTNVAFLIAGGVLIRLLSKEPGRVPVSLWLLPVTTVVVGLCSLAFHTVATGFTGLLDTVAILAFILIAVVLTVHHVWTVPWRRSWLAAPGFVVFMLGINAALATIGGEHTLLGGGYLPALVGLVGFGLAIRFKAPAESRRFGTLVFWAAAVFAVSLAIRTLDGPLCGQLPVGVHFLWHCLNATVLFLVGYTLFRCYRAQAQSAVACG